MVMIQSSQTTSTFRKLAAQQAQNNEFVEKVRKLAAEQAQNKKKEEEGKFTSQMKKFAE
jgi:hypothetical protein